MTSSNKLRVGIAGVGYFGRFHAQKSASHPREELVGVVDKNLNRAQLIASEVGCKVYSSLEDLLKDIDALIIVTPAITHSEIATAALRAGKHVFVEKPVATDLKQAKAIEELAIKSQCVCHVGHLLRYSFEQEILDQNVKTPRRLFFERSTKPSERGKDVSVVLDLMIHDLDYLASSSLKGLGAIKGLEVDKASDDEVKVRLTFSTGCRADLLASRVSKKSVQQINIYTDDRYIQLDALNHRGTIMSAFDEKDISSPQHVEWEKQDLLFKEHDIFVSACLDGKPSNTTISQVMQTQEMAERIMEALPLSSL